MRRTLIRPGRDLRIDFFRGIALWSIYIDHLMIGWLREITLQQYALCDVAEWFVLLSGISAGIVYQRAMTRDGLRAARLKIARRAAAIYRAHLIMFTLFVVEVGVLVASLNPPSFLEFSLWKGSAPTFFAAS